MVIVICRHQFQWGWTRSRIGGSSDSPFYFRRARRMGVWLFLACLLGIVSMVWSSLGELGLKIESYLPNLKPFLSNLSRLILGTMNLLLQ